MLNAVSLDEQGFMGLLHPTAAGIACVRRGFSWSVLQTLPHVPFFFADPVVLCDKSHCGVSSVFSLHYWSGKSWRGLLTFSCADLDVAISCLHVTNAFHFFPWLGQRPGNQVSAGFVFQCWGTSHPTTLWLKTTMTTHHFSYLHGLLSQAVLLSRGLARSLGWKFLVAPPTHVPTHTISSAEANCHGHGSLPYGASRWDCLVFFGKGWVGSRANYC